MQQESNPMFSRFIQSNIFFLFSVNLFRRTLFAAYIDPNTGGMLFQLLAVLFGIFSGLILFFSGRIKMVFYRAMRFLRGSKQSELSETKIDAKK